MSENILIGKRRKDGKWEFLVDPDEPYDAHLRAYQKISASYPVYNLYTKVRLGRLQNTSTPLTLISDEENKARQAATAKSNEAATNAGASAEERQAAINKANQDALDKRHAEEIANKNKIIEGVRKSSGQPATAAPPVTETKK